MVARINPELTPLALNPAPDMLTPEIVTSELPLFVTVTVRELLPPMPTFPKLKLVGLVASKRVAATPVPVRTTVTGLLVASLEIAILPDPLPTVVGENAAVTVTCWPGARLKGTVAPLTLNS